MKPNIFTSTKHWRFTASDEAAEQKFKQLEAATRGALPQNFYKRPLVCFDLIRASPLYSLLKTIPKGAMHHNHYFCNDDADFYRRHILTDPRVYLTADGQSIEFGTKAQAETKGWVSMAEGAAKWGEEEWLLRIVALTCFTPSEMESLDYKTRHTWELFENKIRAPLKIFFVRDIFEKYSRHMLEKYIKNGYDRVEFRTTYERLNEYDAQGNFVKRHEFQTFINSLETIIEWLTQIYPNFSFGMIFVGFKVWKEEFSEEMFEMACRTNWKRLVGFDYVQEEDMYESLASYDPIIDRVLQRHPHLAHLRKAYHAGETSNHLTDNVDVAVKAGSVRIGHGINILQRTQFLPHCRNICFQKNPISNLLLGYKADLRDASGPVLLGLGYPVSISPDDPGKFGYEDTTADYFVAALCYNWSLRHLKLIGYHSINHAICEENVKSHLISNYEKAWDAWVHSYLQLQHVTAVREVFPYEDIFTFASNWSFSELEDRKNTRFTQIVEKVVADIPQNMYQNSFFESKGIAQSSPLFTLLKAMPKGTLQSCHFIANHDAEFIRLFVVPHHDIYINDYSKQLSIATPQESEQHGWKSLERVKLELAGEQQVADYVYSLTAFTAKELTECSGHQTEFHRIYDKKKANLQTLLVSEYIFRKYTRHTLKKLADSGYLRVEFRLEPIKLIKYSQIGEKLQDYGYNRMIEIIDEEYSVIAQLNRGFTVGFIILGNKGLSKEENTAVLQAFAQLRWSKCIGFDFEQGIEDSHPPLHHFTSLIDEVLLKHDDLPYHRVIQAGNSSDHLNSNIETALQNGAQRICNGLNILQQTSLLNKCRQVCFEVNPIRNLAEGASKRTDFRLSIAPILLGLGFPVTVNSDLSGMLGFDDTTYDLFVAAISFNWSLKHFKLMLLHSINHSCATEGRQKLMLKAFAERWEEWIKTVLE